MASQIKIVRGTLDLEVLNSLCTPTALSEDFVRRALQMLVTRFMPLNTNDLESWLADPEEWVNLEEKDNEQWEYELRASDTYIILDAGLMNIYSRAESVCS